MRLLSKFLLLSLALFLFHTSAYGQHRLVRVDVKTQSQFERLAPLGLDIASSLRGSHVDVIVEPGDMDRIALLGFKYDVILEDIEASLSSIMVEGLGDYRSYSEATEELLAAVESHPTIAVADSIGRSYLNRPIWAVKISDRPLYDDPSEPDVLLVGLHHARELMTVEVLMYLMHYLLDNYGSDPRVTRLVDDREIWIVPVLNPDGHVHMEGQYPAPIWRKNRRPTPSPGCIGVDLNRNYGYMWGYDDRGSSPAGCSEDYRGEKPFSEWETRAIRDLIMDEDNDFTMAVSYHSYGKLILFPWGYTPELTPDHVVFAALADSMAAYNGYTAGPGYSTIYATNGDMDDWMYGDQVVTEGMDPRYPKNEKDRIFAFTFEVGETFIYEPPGPLMEKFSRENLYPNLLAIEYADDPYRILAPAAPIVDGAVRRSDGGWVIGLSPASMERTNAPVAFEVDLTFSPAMSKDGFESGIGYWEGRAFSLSKERAHSGYYSLHTGNESNLRATLEPVYPLHPESGDSLSLRAWYSMPDGHNFFVEVSEDGGDRYIPLPGTLTLQGEAPRGFSGVLTGDSGGWAGVHISLDSYAGREIALRFRCSTNAKAPTGGVYLDEVGPILTYRERKVRETPSYLGKYELEPYPEPVLFRARSVDAEGQRSGWTSATELEAFEGVLRRLTVTPSVLTSSARVAFVASDGNSGSETVPVRLEVFDAAGRLVRTLFRGMIQGDMAHERTWDCLTDDGKSISSGVYFVVLTIRNDRIADKVMVVGGR